MKMKTQNKIRLLLGLNIAGSTGLLVWWFLFPLLLPISDASGDFQNLILDPDWVAVNLIGLLSCLFLCLGLPGIFVAHQEKFSLSGFAGLLLAVAGLILFTAIQYYETLVWPVVAGVQPEMVRADGALVSGHKLVVSGLLVSGFILGAGYLLFGAASLRARLYPRIPLWFLMLGAVVFGNGILFPVRTAGVILFMSGNIWLSVRIRKSLTEHTN
jgi:hypothetical protein